MCKVIYASGSNNLRGTVLYLLCLIVWRGGIRREGMDIFEIFIK